MKILIVDDEEIQRVSLEDDLVDNGFEVCSLASPCEALQRAADWLPDVVLSDLRMPEMDGLSFVRELRRQGSKAEVIVMTAYSTVDTAVEAMRLGAIDYLTKPFALDELLLRLRRTERLKMIEDENISLREQLTPRTGLSRLVGDSLAITRLRDQITMAAESDTTILLEGETGTGKDLVAEVIHSLSTRRDGPLIKVSCALFAPEVLESELFGHEQGAFTGAARRKLGRFEMATGGTIYLDEVDDMPYPMQVKLLRVLEDRVIERVGGSRPIPVDVRVVAATKESLWAMAEEKRFRHDLYYRLNVYPITLPPLRTRTEDVPALLRHFLRKSASGAAPGLSEAAEACLMQYDWPGNVRQLRNEAERLSLACRCDPVLPQCFSAEILAGAESGSGAMDHAGEGNLVNSLAIFEVNLLRQALREAGGNRAEAARRLGIPVTTLKSKLKKYDLND